MPGRVVATCTSRDTLAPAARSKVMMPAAKTKRRRLLRFTRIETSFVYTCRENTKKVVSDFRVKGNTKFNIENLIDPSLYPSIDEIDNFEFILPISNSFRGLHDFFS